MRVSIGVGAAALVIAGLAPAGVLAHDIEPPPPGAVTPGQGNGENLDLVATVPAPDTVSTDLAFWGRFAYAGSFDGFRVIDISEPERPEVRADVRCPGGQGDVSAWDGLLFVSVDEPQSSSACTGVPVEAADPRAWEGIRIFDLRAPDAPELIAAVATPCGSHTNTAVPDPDGDRVLVYVSSMVLDDFSVGPACTPARNAISIVEVPLAEPAAARLLAEPALPADMPTFTLEVPDLELPGLVAGRGCHDMGAAVGRGLLAAACFSEGAIWDISDPERPAIETGRRFHNPRVGVWHSAAFSYDGEVVAFGDEAFGAILPSCEIDDPETRGAIWLYDAVDGRELGHYKIPRPVADVCTAHNFGFVPTTDGRRLLVSAWYAGGVSVADVTDPEHPRELAFRVPPGAATWSAYWYNGHVYANDINRGVDVYRPAGTFVPEARVLPHLNPPETAAEPATARSGRSVPGGPLLVALAAVIGLVAAHRVTPRRGIGRVRPPTR